MTTLNHSLYLENDSKLPHNPPQTDFRSIVENSLDFMIKVDLTGHYTYVNPAFCALYGISAQTLIGRHYSQDVLEEDRAMVDEFFNKLFLPPYNVHFTHRENTVHGVRCLEWTGKGITNAQGQLLEFVGIARDVTERLDLINKLARQAHQDDLTGLANRRFLMQQANIESDRAKRYQYPISFSCWILITLKVLMINTAIYRAISF